MSQRHSEYKPVAGDLYCTPEWVTAVLCEAEDFPSRIWEPACGDYHIIDALIQMGHDHIRGTDINEGNDFFDYDYAPLGCRSIVTNPPYSNGMAEKFVRHAIRLMESRDGKVAMLLPLAWDSAKGRRDLFADHPAFKVKYTLTKRIRWENLEQKKNGPSQNHAWFVWDWNNSTPPVCGYLP